MTYLGLLVGLISLFGSFASGHRVFLITLQSLINGILTETASPRLFDRAFPNAPDGYTPAAGNCPSDRPTIRSASRLSQNEISWLQLRRNKTVDPMRDFLGRLDFGNFEAASYISDNAQNVSALPNIAIAVSGGGYRALMNGGKGRHAVGHKPFRANIG